MNVNLQNCFEDTISWCEGWFLILKVRTLSHPPSNHQHSSVHIHPPHRRFGHPLVQPYSPIAYPPPPMLASLSRGWLLLQPIARRSFKSDSPDVGRLCLVGLNFSHSPASAAKLKWRQFT